MFVGVDNLKGAWLACIITDEDCAYIHLYKSLSQLWQELSGATEILIDMPIGLPPPGEKGRSCDLIARKILGPKRACSVFPVPCREVIYASNYNEARELNKKIARNSISRQTWNLTSQIREVDLFLSLNPVARKKIRETHPEVCFWALAGGRPMVYGKKTKEGKEERREVLSVVYPPTEKIIKKFARFFPEDDLLDALSCAVTAFLGFNRWTSLPSPPPLDERGLPMEIVFFLIKK